VLDKENNFHVFGKVFKDKGIGNHAGFNVYDANQLFDGGKVSQLSVQYEMFGALAQHN